MTNQLIQNKEGQKGQVLLIIIMLLATVITVVTTISFKSTTETQISKLEEESQKTLAAAEAGIEKVIGERKPTGSYVFGPGASGLDLDNLSGINLSSSKVQISTDTTSTFVSPLLQKDQQFTFYLADYSTATNNFSNPYNGTIRFRYGSEGACTAIALEITIISGSGSYTVDKYIADRSNILSSNTNDIYNSSSPQTINGITFNCQTSTLNIVSTNDPRLIIVRAISDKTRVAFLGSTTLRPQGKFIVSEAQSDAGVVKKIQLFQSLPQIPAEFFVSTL